MSNKPKQASNVSWVKSDRSVRVPGARDEKGERRSLKANVRSSVTKEGSQSDQRRAAFEALDSKQLQRKGGIEQGLKTIETSMAQIRALKANYREEQRYAVAYCCGLAQHLRNDKEAWDAFCQDRFWQGYKGCPTKADRSEALRFVLRWANHTKGKEASKHVSKIHSAVRPFFDQGVPAQEIPSKIEEGGGFAKLASAHAKKPRGKDRADPQKGTGVDEQGADRSEVRKLKLIGKNEFIQPLILLPVGSTMTVRVKAVRDEQGHRCLKVVKLLSTPATGQTTSERRKSTPRQGKPTPHRVKQSIHKRRTA